MSDQNKREESETGGPGAAAPKPRRKTRSKPKPKTRKLPPFNVILLNDDDHTYDYVIEMLKKIFGHPEEAGQQFAKEVDSTGRVIVLTTHKELAELKRDQILGYGADWRLEKSAGSMSAVIEPADGEAKD